MNNDSSEIKDSDIPTNTFSDTSCGYVVVPRVMNSEMKQKIAEVPFLSDGPHRRGHAVHSHV